MKTPAHATIAVLIIVRKAGYIGKSTKDWVGERANWIDATESQIRIIAAQWIPDNLVYI